VGQPAVQADQGPAPPGPGGAQVVDRRRHDQALVATPGIADAEEPAPLAQGGERALALRGARRTRERLAVELEREQAARAREIAPPELVPRMPGQRGMQYARDPRLALEPAGDGERVLLVGPHAHADGA